MTWYAVTDSDWDWDGEDGPAVVEASSPEEAAKFALAKWDEIDRADGGHMKIAELALVGFIGFDREGAETTWDQFAAVKPDADRAALIDFLCREAAEMHEVAVRPGGYNAQRAAKFEQAARILKGTG